jgi:hypothetical protein
MNDQTARDLISLGLPVVAGDDVQTEIDPGSAAG